MIKSCCRFGKIAEAMALFKRLRATDIKVDSTLYNMLLDGCAKSKNLQLAFQVFENMQEDVEVGLQTISFNSMIDACVRAGEFGKAWSLLDQMKS